MIKNIENIFKRTIFLLGLIEKMVHYFRIQNYDTALRNASIAIEHLGILLQELSMEQDFFDNNIENFSGFLGGLLSAQENKDYILLADLYEIQIIPYLYQLQEMIILNDKVNFEEDLFQSNLKVLNECNKELASILNEKRMADIDSKYQVEYASCGFKTLVVKNSIGSFYLHSNKNVQSEAFILANSWYQEEKSKYIIYGLGFGYHIIELANLDYSIEIDVYECDINVIRLACNYMDIKVILSNPKIHIHYDPDLMKLLKHLQNIDEESEFVIHSPSLRLIGNLAFRDRIEEYFIQYSSAKNQIRYLNANFRENIKNYDESVDILKDKFKGKDLYIIAAGPSLDKNFKQLKEIGSNGIILASGTVLKKLCNEGIRPNYFIVSDAYARVYNQIAGFEQETIPILLLSSAFYGFANNYQGKKYLICQDGYSRAETYAKEKGYNLYQTGGSVITVALDIGIQFECKRIIFLGLDLGFPGNLAHAEGTSRRKLESTDNLRQIMDINGNSIYTTKVLSIYRQWIEKRIQNIKNIEFIDASEGGARIKGMKIMDLSEVLANNKR